MGVNWNSKTNPESIPNLRFIPRISLPTVFGDALSYMEQVGKINAAINQVIDSMNDFGQNAVQIIATEIENAKLPVYDSLVYNGSVIPSPNNWNFGNVERVYKAIQDGKMVILGGNFSFNNAGIPVYNEAVKQYLILTEVYQPDPTEPNKLEARFMSYSSTHIRYLSGILNFDGSVYSGAIQTFLDFEIPTTEYVNNIYNYLHKKLMVYKGDNEIPSETDQYVELTNNGSNALAENYIAGLNDGVILLKDVCDGIVIGKKNSNVGIMIYGGDDNPWVRIFGTGIKLHEDIYNKLTIVDDDINNILQNISQLNGTDIALGNRITEVENKVENLPDDVTLDLSNCVQYTTQTKTPTEKAIACQNIGAVDKNHPDLFSPITIADNYTQAEILVTLDLINNVPILMFEEGVPILRNVADPVAANDVANKKYVDEHAGGGSAVLYVAQSLTDEEKATARSNIRALAEQNPATIGTLRVRSGDIYMTWADVEVALMAQNVDGAKVLVLGPVGRTVLRNVETPVQPYDAANKSYVDNRVANYENAVLYVAQNPTDEQKDLARNNIGACKKVNAEIDVSATIIGTSTSVQPRLNLAHAGSQYESGASLSSDENDIVYFKKDELASYTKVRFAPGESDNDGVTMAQLNERTSAIQLSIDAGSSQWSDGYNRTVTQITNMMFRGYIVTLSYQPTVESAPIIMTAFCSDYEHIYFKGYVAGNERTLRLNNDNTFAIS